MLNKQYSTDINVSGKQPRKQCYKYIPFDKKIPCNESVKFGGVVACGPENYGSGRRCVNVFERLKKKFDNKNCDAPCKKSIIKKLEILVKLKNLSYTAKELKKKKNKLIKN